MKIRRILSTLLCLCAIVLLFPAVNLTAQGASTTILNESKGVLSMNYSGNYSEWKDIAGEYKAISVTAKNYLPMAQSTDGNGKIGYSMVLRVTLDNGKFYAFRIINDLDVRYGYSRFGTDGAANGWDGWCWIDTKDTSATSLINGSGAEFKVERTAANILTVTLNGKVLDTYTMEGVTASNKVVSVGVKHYGNPASTKYAVKVPYTVTYARESVKVQTANTSNGKVTTDKNLYRVGDTVKLTLTPNSGYCYKTLKVNGKTVTPNTSGIYSFVAQENTYEVSATFTKAVFTENTGDHWNLIHQGAGKLVLNKHSSGNSGWLKAVNNVSDITTTVRDYYPAAKDFSMIYQFTFNNGEKICLRLNGTDSDGKYKIQVMSGSTLSEQWKNHYTLTDAQITKVKDSGIKFRTAIEGSNAVVYLDGTKVCSIDLSKIVETGKASYIKNMPVRVELRMDGNLNKSLTIPFQMTNSIVPITVTIPAFSNGKVTADKTTCAGGDTVKLTVTPNSGYCYKTLKVNGKTVTPNTSGVYSFVAQESTYEVSATFTKAVFTENTGDSWNLIHQGAGKLVMNKHSSGNSGWLKAVNNVSDITTTVRDYYPAAKDFSMIYQFTFNNGEKICLRLNGTDSDGKYKIQVMSGSTLSEQWKNHYTLTDAQITKVKDSGIKFRTAIEGSNAVVYLDGTKVCSIDLSKIVETGKASYIKNMPVRVELRMDGNLNKSLTIPFQMTNSIVPITVTIPAFSNGKVTADKTTCVGGDTVKLTVTPNSGYSQKLTLNGEPILLDQNGTYSFIANESTYKISGEFVKSNSWGANANVNKHNDAYGVLMLNYTGNDSGWMDLKGEYNAFSVTAKNYLPMDKSADGNGNIGYSMVLRVTMDNGKFYAFRIINEVDVRYAYSRYGAEGAATGWNGRCWLDTKDSAVTSLINGDGAEFKIARTGANTLTVTLNGKVLDTYTMEGVKSSNKIVSVGFKQYGNAASSNVVKVPFAFSTARSWNVYQFKTSELSKYVIVYSTENPDYLTFANQLADTIYAKYGKKLSVVSDVASTPTAYEILLGDTNRYNYPGRVMEYSVTVDEGKFKINIGGSCSGEKAIAYLCANVFNGQSLTLNNGEYYKSSLLTSSRAVTGGTTARIMTANMLADAFADSSYKKAHYRAEIFAGMLVSYTPDVLGLQETDANWNQVLDGYLAKIQKTHGIKYSRYLTTYEGKINYTSLLYRSDKFKVENSGVKVFSWWADKTFNHSYHMRNVSWAQFTSLSNSSKKFIVANTHWSYRTEYDNGKTYLSGSSTPIATNELRTQCKNETNTFLTSLKKTYPEVPIFLTGDFNTSLPFFTQSGWTPSSFNIISEQAKSNGTALSTVPTSGHFDHIFGTGNYTVKCYEFFKDCNQHSLLSDHPYAYVDLAF